MNDQIKPPRNITLTALLLELGLVIVALAIAAALGRLHHMGLDLSHASLGDNSKAFAFGIAATVPMFALLVFVRTTQIELFRKFNQDVDRMVKQLFGKTSILNLALISAAAGLGEELLFRGVIQVTISDWIGGLQGVVFGLVIASLLFGVCHWLSVTYAVFAAIIGVYFGLLLVFTDNLIVPIVAHGLYDFVALTVLVKHDTLPELEVDEFREL